jgi:hypothetical protein
MEIVVKVGETARKRFNGFYALQKTFSLAERCSPLERSFEVALDAPRQ